MWFKAKLNEDGSIASCEPVEAVREGTKYVCYIEAPDRAAAVVQAKGWWEKYVDRIKAEHDERDRFNEQRRKQKEAAEAKGRRLVRLAEDAAGQARTKVLGPRAAAAVPTPLDLRTLYTVLRAFDGNPKGIRRWLRRHIDAEETSQKARSAAFFGPEAKAARP